MKKILLAAVLVLFAAQAHASVEELINLVKQNNIPAILNLMQNGENINAADKDGNTALHYAVAMDNATMADVLLNGGADMNIVNAKGWSPLKIAEQKNVPNVTKILEKAMRDNQPQAAAPEPQVAPAPAPVAVSEPSADELAEYKNKIELAKQALINAEEVKAQMENRNRELENEVNKLRAQNSSLEQRLNAKDREVKEAQEKAVKAAKEATEKAAKEKAAKEAAAKAAKEKAAREAQKKAELEKIKQQTKPSTLNPSIFAGDEEIVYCLHYLGQGENQNMKRAAGFFAAGASITENRYRQITELSDAFRTMASDEEKKVRNEACGKIITPKDALKQNEVIRSMNSAVGY